jgi:hypothetical protein
MANGEFKDALDHPVSFVVLMTIAVVCMSALFSWGFKAAHLPGPAGLFQHP